MGISGKHDIPNNTKVEGSKWTVLKVSRREKRNSGKTYKVDTYYLCQCDCGKVKEVNGKNLKSGRSKSCGCMRGKK